MFWGIKNTKATVEECAKHCLEHMPNTVDGEGAGRATGEVSCLECWAGDGVQTSAHGRPTPSQLSRGVVVSTVIFCAWAQARRVFVAGCDVCDSQMAYGCTRMCRFCLCIYVACCFPYACVLLNTGPFKKLPCNAFAFCPDDVCFEPDAHHHTKVGAGGTGAALSSSFGMLHFRMPAATPGRLATRVMWRLLPAVHELALDRS